ncbi:hypothetical protein GJ496_004052 [Pomphorhynchus laevis]|nr:hypothetical protein GJ496_004052 [Pomphorhynchus laevis]
MMANLFMNPKARELLNDPEARQVFANLQSGKFDAQTLNNPKVMELLGLAIGINPDKSGGPSAETAYSANNKHSESTKQSEPVVKELPKADVEKEEGNKCYKKKDFDGAIQHYDKAIELDPSNMTYLTNKSAVYYEMKDYEKCRELCLKAVEVGRENKADFKNVAKALARIGNSYFQEENYEMAVKYFEHSLAEHRNPDIVKLKDKASKILKELERKRMINPEKAEEEKNKGNEFFQKGDYPSAIKHYSEAITRNPDDPRYYSNRAACYSKLMEFELALRDCDESIKRDPQFIKAFLRKGAALTGMQQYSRAGDAYTKALELDPSCQEAWEGRRLCESKSQSNPDDIKKRALNDPEIRDILADPAMRLILEQMQDDPTALREHMKNGNIRDKIQKLIDAGIIGIRHA